MNPISALVLDKVNWATVGKIVLGFFVLIALFYYFRKYTKVRVIHDDTPYIRCSGSVSIEDARKIKTLVEDANRVLSTTSAPAFIDAVLPSAWMDWVFDKVYGTISGASERCKVLQTLFDLNTNQFIAFHNAYMRTYSKTFKTSLNEIGFTGCSGGQYDLLQARLNRLKLP